MKHKATLINQQRTKQAQQSTSMAILL